jgi:hypothetical protein
MGIALASLPFLVLGFVVGRWFVLAVPVAFWTIFFVGVGAGLWGSGFGDAWELAVLFVVAAAVAAAAIGVLLRRALAFAPFSVRSGS